MNFNDLEELNNKAKSAIHQFSNFRGHLCSFYPLLLAVFTFFRTAIFLLDHVYREILQECSTGSSSNFLGPLSLVIIRSMHSFIIKVIA